MSKDFISALTYKSDLEFTSRLTSSKYLTSALTYIIVTLNLLLVDLVTLALLLGKRPCYNDDKDLQCLKVIQHEYLLNPAIYQQHELSHIKHLSFPDHEPCTHSLVPMLLFFMQYLHAFTLMSY